MRAIATPDPFLCIGIATEQEEIMRVTGLIVALLAAGSLAVLGQEGTVENVKQGAKKAGEKVKEGVETVGEKTKQAAETVAEKTKETAETVGKKTKETVETVGEKTKEGARTAHRKSKKAVSKTKAQAGEERSSNREPNTPSPTDH
jgi:gas vesicle protein